MTKPHPTFSRLAILVSLLTLVSIGVAQTPTNVTVLPNTITAGANTTGMVALSIAAPKAETLQLVSNTPGLNVPAGVNIPKGQQFISFPISSKQTLATSTVAITASLNGGSAVGFLLVSAPPVTYPAFSSLVLSPSINALASNISATLTFTQPLVVPITFNLSSSNSNFTVPSSLTVKAGASSGTFAVTTSSSAVTAAVTVTATLATGNYQNVFTGATSITGSFTYIAGLSLPANYMSGFWVSQSPSSDGKNVFFTMRTYPDGSLAFGYINVDPSTGDYSGENYFSTTAHTTATGQLKLLDAMIGSLFQTYGSSDPSYGPPSSFDVSTLSFSANGTANLGVISQQYTLKFLTTPPVFALGNKVSGGSYTFKLVQKL